jgi:hypothetical protein
VLPTETSDAQALKKLNDSLKEFYQTDNDLLKVEDMNQLIEILEKNYSKGVVHSSQEDKWAKIKAFDVHHNIKFFQALENFTAIKEASNDKVLKILNEALISGGQKEIAKIDMLNLLEDFNNGKIPSQVHEGLNYFQLAPALENDFGKEIGVLSPQENNMLQKLRFAKSYDLLKVQDAKTISSAKATPEKVLEISKAPQLETANQIEMPSGSDSSNPSTDAQINKVGASAAPTDAEIAQVKAATKIQAWQRGIAGRKPAEAVKVK